MASTSASDFEASAAAFAQLASYSAAQQEQQQQQQEENIHPDLKYQGHHDHGDMSHGDMSHGDMSHDMASTSSSADPSMTMPHGSHHSHLVAESSHSSSSRLNNSPFAKHLGRNRACQACRERKLKCDGTRPICGQCNRAWQNRRKALDTKKASASEYELLDQPCTYIDIEPRQERKKSSGAGPKTPKAAKTAGSKGGASTSGAAKNTIAEVEKERQRLEAEVAALKSQLRQVETIRVKAAAHSEQGSSGSPAALATSAGGGVPMLGTGFQATSDELSIAEILANTMRAGDGPMNQRSPPLEYADGSAQAAPGTSDFGMSTGGQGRIIMDPNLESLVGNFVGEASGSGPGGAGTSQQHDMTGAAALHHVNGPPNMTGTSIYHHPLNGGQQQHHHQQQQQQQQQHPPQQSGFHGHGVSQVTAQGRVGSQLEPMMLAADKGSVAPSTASSGFSPGTTHANAMASGGSGGNTGEPDPMLELIFSGWPKDFPPPGAVDHLVSVFFDSFPFLPVFHPGRFFASLTHGPKSAKYPHHSVLHSMFALAYTLRPELDPVVPTPFMPQTRREKEAAMEVELQQRLADVMDANRPRDPRDQPRLAQYARDSRLDRERAKSGSAGYHSARAVELIQRGTWEGGNIFDVCRAAVLLCNKK